MAKHRQLWLKGSKGKLAGTTFYQTSGVTIQREINYDPSNPRTDKQMTQRTKLANLVNMYRAAKDFFPRAFENKKPLESDYNKFVSYNLTASDIYLTKGEAAKGIYVPIDYIITQGSLPTVGLAEATNALARYKAFGASTLSAAATVAEVSAVVMSQIPAAQPGDQVSCVFFSNKGGVMTFASFEFILSTESTTQFSTLLPSGWTFAPTVGITVSHDNATVAVACVLSRTVAGKTLVSSEQLAVQFGSEYSGHSSDAAKKAAIDSYGASKKVFLDNK